MPTSQPARSASGAREDSPVFLEALARCSYSHPDFFWTSELLAREAGAAVLKQCAGYASDGTNCRILRRRLLPEALTTIRAAARASGLAETPARAIAFGGSMSEALRRPALIEAVIHLGDASVVLPECCHPEDEARVAPCMRTICQAVLPLFCCFPGI